MKVGKAPLQTQRTSAPRPPKFNALGREQAEGKIGRGVRRRTTGAPALGPTGRSRRTSAESYPRAQIHGLGTMQPHGAHFLRHGNATVHRR